jgi:beta-carotene ketolase (CrtW type)
MSGGDPTDPDLQVSEVLNYAFAGLWRALAVLGAWAVLLAALLWGVQLTTGNWFLVLATLPVQTFLNVGLFITAHDAMHRSLLPRHAVWNDRLGRLAVLAYALFSYNRLKACHMEHHASPASPADPDFHRKEARRGFWRWYLDFMARYVTWRQWLGMPTVFAVLHWNGNVPMQNLFAFWVFPAILSTIQLFYFGTYLPHREPPNGYCEPHRAISSGLPVWASFLTCYHFGYHWEHHAHPYAPWWKLPHVRQVLSREANFHAGTAASYSTRNSAG